MCFAISGGRGGRGSSLPARAEASPALPRATDPTHSRQSGSRNTSRPPGRIETLGVAPLPEIVSSSFAPPTCSAVDVSPVLWGSQSWLQPAFQPALAGSDDSHMAGKAAWKGGRSEERRVGEEGRNQ